MEANTYARFEFDETVGRMRAVLLGTTPVDTKSWGSIKTLYR
jgi:hypothetical protein